MARYFFIPLWAIVAASCGSSTEAEKSIVVLYSAQGWTDNKSESWLGKSIDDLEDFERFTLDAGERDRLQSTLESRSEHTVVGECFIPRHAILFLEGDRIDGALEICFECMNHHGAPADEFSNLEYGMIADALRSAGIPSGSAQTWNEFSSTWQQVQAELEKLNE